MNAIEQAIADQPFTFIRPHGSPQHPLIAAGVGFFLYPTADPSLLREVVPIVLQHESGSIEGIGSAFAVASLQDGTVVLATAAHNVRKLRRSSVRLAGSGESGRFVDYKLAVNIYLMMSEAVEPVDAARHFDLVRVDKMCIAPELYDPLGPPEPAYSDSALLLVKWPAHVQLPHVWSLSPAEPAVGTACRATGYTKIEEGFWNGPDERSFAVQIARSDGVITEVHPSTGHDTVRQFPLFTTNAFYPFGLSGAPVIDDRDQVIGIVSSSWDSESGHCALIGGLIELKVDFVNSEGETERISFGQLVGNGAVQTDGSSFVFQRSTDGITIHWPSDEERGENPNG
jgi:hypothetical protein